MKKILLSFVLTGVLAFAFTACGGSDTGTEETTAAQTETEAAAEEVPDVVPGEIVDEDGNPLEGFTSGTETYEFITYGKPLADKEDDSDGTKTYIIYVGEKGSDEEETVMIGFNFQDFTSEGSAIDRSGVESYLMEQEGMKQTDFKEMSIDGADALQYTQKVGDYDTTYTTIFKDGNYINVMLYCVDADPSDFAKQIYKDVIGTITINE